MLPNKFKILRSEWVCVLSLLATASIAQTTINVGPGQPYTTIQSGINAANNGDTVLVAPGTYSENINFNGKAITVTSSNGAAVTTIDGPNDDAAVIFMNGETRASVLSNFTITGGGQYDKNLMGGIYISGASPTILNNTVTKTECYGINSQNSSPLIQGNEISYVRGQGYQCSSAGGAGIWLYGQKRGTFPLIIGNTIENNTESGLEDTNGNGGAGIAIWEGPSVIIQSNIIRNNATGKYGSAAGGGQGGGIFFAGAANALIANNLITGNTSNLDGGGMTFSGFLDGPAHLTMINNTIVDNAVVPVTTYSQQVLGGQQIYFYSAGQGSAVTFANNIISGSTTGATIVCYDESVSSITYENNDVYNAVGPNTSAVSSGICVYPEGLSGNISADPMFSPTESYHPQLASPAVDTGDNAALKLTAPYGVSLFTDLAANPRIQDAAGKGCIVDMGAFEYPGTLNQCGITVKLTSSLNPSLFGQRVTFTAQVSSAYAAPTGTVQFLEDGSVLSTETLYATGPAILGTSTLAVGSHTITAAYQPTATTVTEGTASLTQVVDGLPTNTGLTCLPNPVLISYPARFTANLTSANGTPTGSVSFTDNGDQFGYQPLLDGTTSQVDNFSTVGTHNIVATYTPTGSYAASSESCSEVVSAFPTTSVLKVTPATSIYGSPLTLAATVTPARDPSPGPPTSGTVTFLNGTSTLGTATLVNGVATLASVTLPSGSHDLTCAYGGDAIYATSNCNSVPVTINSAQTALRIVSSNDPAPALSTITFTAKLIAGGQSAGAGNTLNLSVNGQSTSLTTDSTGSATYTISTLTRGSYPVTVSFAGTNNYLASSASLTQVITALADSTALSALPNPGYLNQSVTIVATVSALATSAPAPTGSVNFFDGSASLGSAPISGGAATLITSFSTIGLHNLTAIYAGDSVFGPSSNIFAETIKPGDFSMAVQPNSATVYTGESASFQVSVTPLHGFNQVLALTCTGLPANATCAFSPASLPGGQGYTSLVMQTAAPHQAGGTSASISGTTAVLGTLTLLLLPGRRRRRRFMAGLSLVLLAIFVGMGMSGCGSPNPITGGTPPGAYQVAVTATGVADGTTITHSSVVTLTVKSLF